MESEHNAHLAKSEAEPGVKAKDDSKTKQVHGDSEKPSRTNNTGISSQRHTQIFVMLNGMEINLHSGPKQNYPKNNGQSNKGRPYREIYRPPSMQLIMD